jgi:LemA protein
MLLFIWFFAIQIVMVFIGFYITLSDDLRDAKNRTAKTWNAVDLVLKQRQEEIRKLLDLYREALGQDHDVFEQISLAKKKLLYAEGPGAKSLANSEIQDAMKQLHVLAERSPNLKVQTILQLEQGIASMESKIVDLARRYNNSATGYNQKIKMKPECYVAWIQGTKPLEMFK